MPRNILVLNISRENGVTLIKALNDTVSAADLPLVAAFVLMLWTLMGIVGMPIGNQKILR